ncbi:hypothetical protein OZX60_05180 [Streptococcaceae bacterium ESL0687]|nr:hypothetical protein OZX60_05180 [Streptococcaceae bacterium ESL0687]
MKTILGETFRELAAGESKQGSLRYLLHVKSFAKTKPYAYVTAIKIYWSSSK